ncbi:MAG: hypothetical protein AAGI63_05440 [Planctomycetota bacterium]
MRLSAVFPMLLGSCVCLFGQPATGDDERVADTLGARIAQSSLLIESSDEPEFQSALDFPSPSLSLEWVTVQTEDLSPGKPQPGRKVPQSYNTNPQDPDSIRRQAALEQHLRKLRKPIDEVVVSTSITEKPTPTDRGGPILASDRSLLIQSEGAGPVISNRYPILMTHQPLYFEQPNLERCGNACGYFQNAISAAHFASRTVTLPYHICRNRNHRCVVAGGDCRCCEQMSNCQWDECLPLDARALTSEAATLVGFSLLLL